MWSKLKANRLVHPSSMKANTFDLFLYFSCLLPLVTKWMLTLKLNSSPKTYFSVVNILSRTLNMINKNFGREQNYFQVSYLRLYLTILSHDGCQIKIHIDIF